MNDEQWLPINGYEGLYEISNKGNVKSLNYRNRGEVKELKCASKAKYYIKVSLVKDGVRKCHRIHRLVAMAFLSHPQDGQTQVEHINTLKSDNRVENLRWVTAKDNMANELTRRHMSEGHKNPSDETRRRMSLGQKRRFAFERKTKTGRYAKK